MNAPAQTLHDLVETRLAQPVPPAVAAMARHVLALHSGALAVLAYGSSLRGADPRDTLIDLYVLTGSGAEIGKSWASRFFGSLLPPNVYYAETEWEDGPLRCKYAVMTLAAFKTHMGAGTRNPYFWARFSQPTALVHASGAEIRREITGAVMMAVATMYRAGLASAPPSTDPLAVWRRGFEETYRTELRPEGPARALELVSADTGYFRETARLAGSVSPGAINWPARRIAGKLISLARLAKAAFTFSGGASYASWKIERHTGEKLPLSPWQKRHPLLAGLILLPKLWRRGALK